ncbi:MAG: NAD(P)H-dependent oxidoreductase [Candidatus Methylacidiphilales bacterium]|nr:NAD(P)H-dependent oxidoreductase [Candidatus Methylacidiphilales bacterium]
MSTTISPSQLIERLNWRYATKQFDPNKKISPEEWTALEDALMLSPSSGGLQPWNFVVVADPATREKLVPASYGQSQVKDASHLVVFTAMTNFGEADVDAHLERTAKLRGIPLESLSSFRGMLVGGIVHAMDLPVRQAWAARQTYIALGNLLTSAAMLGIDACPMEGFVPDQYDTILGLKAKGLTSTVICTLGYRASEDAYAGLTKVRFAKEDTIIRA